MSDSQNYLVNVTCPHCSEHLVVAISGFGGELAVRIKVCRKCEREFRVHLLAVASTEETLIDGTLTSMRDRITWLNKERKRTHTELLLRHEAAVKLHREALAMAREMRDAHEAN